MIRGLADRLGNNVWLILAREYRQRVRAWSFQITTALGALLILGLAFAPALLDRIQSATGGSIVALVEPEPGLAESLRAALPEELPNDEPRTRIEVADSEVAAERGVENGRYDGLLVSRGGEAGYLYRGPSPGAEVERTPDSTHPPGYEASHGEYRSVLYGGHGTGP